MVHNFDFVYLESSWRAFMVKRTFKFVNQIISNKRRVYDCYALQTVPYRFNILRR